MKLILVRRNIRCGFQLTDKRFIKHLTYLTLLTFLIILPICCCNLRYSVYSLLWKKDVDEGRRLLKLENTERLKIADNFLRMYKKNVKYDQKGNIDVGISIITVSRKRNKSDEYEPKYLTQVVANFLQQLEKYQNFKLTYQLYVCNVDEEPSTFLEASYVSKIVPSFNRFPNTSKFESKSTNLVLEKEKQDYIYCGEQTLLQNVSYVFLVEDDALPRTDLLIVLDYLLTKNKETMNATYIKFYHPERLLGYISFEFERIPELIGISLMMSALFVTLYLKIRPNSNIHLCVLWTASLVYFVLFFLAIGRQNLIELRRISKYLYQITPAPSCCTPANLYPRHGMQHVIKYLKNVTCYLKFGKDTAIDKFRKESKLTALMVQPNLFQHIGMYSSLRENVLNPFIV